MRRLQNAAELCARGDTELREEPVQVRTYRSVREVEPFADVTVREAVRRQLRDLELSAPTTI